MEKVVKSVEDAVVESLRANREQRAKAAQADAHKAAGTVVAAISTVSFKAVACDELGVITLIGGAAGSPEHLDLDGEFLEKADLIAMAFDFCSAPTRTFKANHKDEIECKLVESWVGAPIIKTAKGTRTLKAGEALTSEMDVVGIDIRKGSETHWFVGIQPTDPEIVEIAKAGGIAGASWAGLVNKVEV